MDWHILTPAYGKDYKSKAEVEKAFRDGKDFKDATQGGRYCSVRDFKEGTDIELRYNRIQSVHCIKC